MNMIKVQDWEANGFQISKWFYIDRDFTSSIHHSSHFDYFAWTIANYFLSLACILIETEVRHAGNSVIEW